MFGNLRSFMNHIRVGAPFFTILDWVCRSPAVNAHILTHKLDISYTKMPGWIKLYQDYEHDYSTTFWALARFAYPETRNTNLVTPLPSPATNVSLPPDEQMLCYDYLYYVCAQQVSKNTVRK